MRTDARVARYPDILRDLAKDRTNICYIVSHRIIIQRCHAECNKCVHIRRGKTRRDDKDRTISFFFSFFKYLSRSFILFFFSFFFLTLSNYFSKRNLKIITRGEIRC